MTGQRAVQRRYSPEEAEPEAAGRRGPGAPHVQPGGARAWCSSQHFAEPGVWSGVKGLPSNRRPSRATQPSPLKARSFLGREQGLHNEAFKGWGRHCDRQTHRPS